ncbi:hypothetical protein IV203_006188 [Nitzschia inconspicua]|uniref:L domain-like protein n=1 Tax=Nitzschia inconspicua TaxID=303405 RepID=A0A9K3KNY5_9STRA|nr:hypothetical protein IV203_006188 [Nitzschia inconspicua]
MTTPILSSRLVFSLLASIIVAVVGQTNDFVALQTRIENSTFRLNAAAFQDPTSYQSKALQRTSQQEGVYGFTDSKIAQYYVLYCLYYATYAVPNEITLSDPRFEEAIFPTWLISTNWDKVNIDPCDGCFSPTEEILPGCPILVRGSQLSCWKKLDLEETCHSCRLYLSDKLMTGTLAPIQGMPVIREFWMDANPGLIGTIESWIGDLTTLESLSLAYNSLSGQLPSELGRLTYLKQLWLFGNHFTGKIPSQIGSLNDLAVLQLEGNSLEGSKRQNFLSLLLNRLAQIAMMRASGVHAALVVTWTNAWQSVVPLRERNGRNAETTSADKRVISLAGTLLVYHRRIAVVQNKPHCHSHAI